jgi:hypothetical protein
MYRETEYALRFFLPKEFLPLEWEKRVGYRCLGLAVGKVYAKTKKPTPQYRLVWTVMIGIGG